MKPAKILRKWGIDLRRLGPRGITHRLLEHDLPKVVTAAEPVIFDVGANKGQTSRLMLELFTSPKIYAFEPSRELASNLRIQFAGKSVTVEQLALAAREETRDFVHYENNELSSFLSLSLNQENPFRAVKETEREIVKTRTVASYANSHNIRFIDLLKVDTQGFDLEVLKGAESLLCEGQVGAVQVELNFSPLYSGQCGPGEVIDWLSRHGFSLLGFYEEVRTSLVISWTTALFLPRIISKDAKR